MFLLRMITFEEKVRHSSINNFYENIIEFTDRINYYKVRFNRKISKCLQGALLNYSRIKNSLPINLNSYDLPSHSATKLKKSSTNSNLRKLTHTLKMLLPYLNLYQKLSIQTPRSRVNLSNPSLSFLASNKIYRSK